MYKYTGIELKSEYLIQELRNRGYIIIKTTRSNEYEESIKPKLYTCMTQCPELDNGFERHCTSIDTTKECPCGNIPRWVENKL